MSPIVETHDYLEKERGIAAAQLVCEQFYGRIYIDDRRNAIFPHRNKEGVSGYEIKNRSFTGFAPGGAKGLWHSNISEADKRIVFSETAIDALSYAALKGMDRTRFFSTGGQLNPTQPELILSAIEKMSEGSEVIFAFDNDDGGRALAEQITAHLSPILPSTFVLRTDLPDVEAVDWNAALRASMAKTPVPAFAKPKI